MARLFDRCVVWARVAGMGPFCPPPSQPASRRRRPARSARPRGASAWHLVVGACRVDLGRAISECHRRHLARLGVVPLAGGHPHRARRDVTADSIPLDLVVDWRHEGIVQEDVLGRGALGH